MAIFLAVAGAGSGIGAAVPGEAPAKRFQQIPQVRPGDPCNIAALNQQILQKPRDVTALISRAACNLNTSPAPNRKPPLNNVVSAVADLETALKLDPNNFYAHHNYAQAAYLLGYDDFAVREYTKAVALNPRDARGYLGRGWARSDLCRMNDAAADFAQAVSLDPGLQGQVESPRALAQRKVQCSHPPAPVQAAHHCPAKNIVAFSISARIVLEEEWKRQHPGCP